MENPDFPSYFRNGRAFAAYCRMVPYHIGTGGKVEILGIHNKGNRWIKRLLYEVSQGMYHRVMMMLKKGKDAADGKMPEPSLNGLPIWLQGSR